MGLVGEELHQIKSVFNLPFLLPSVSAKKCLDSQVEFRLEGPEEALASQ